MIITRSPAYIQDRHLLRKWRLTYEGGEDYLKEYILRLSKREDLTDYRDRLALSYNPNVGGSSITKIKNAIYQRMVAVERKGGTASYQAQILSDVTKKNQSMNAFIGNDVLPEMLAMRRVGVYVDMPRLTTGLMDERPTPYLYIYRAEDILAEGYRDGELHSLLLRSFRTSVDEFGLSQTTEEIQTLYRRVLTPEGFRVEVQVHDDVPAGPTSTLENTPPSETIVLDIEHIPFVIFEIRNSLLKDIADHQMALANLASSDMSIAMRGNFPLYTEQYDAQAEAARANIKQQFEIDETGTQTEDKKEDQVGVLHGKKYPKDTDRPGFISPSTDPLKVSMAKQQMIKEEVDVIVNLTLADLSDSDNSPESGLAYIAGILESGERKIAKLWAMYESQTVPNLVINYPRSYTLKTDEAIRQEAKELREFLPEIPILSFQKTLLKDIIKLMYGHKASYNQLERWGKEIDGLKVIKTDPESIREDHKEGLVSDETAALLLGYEEGEAKQASIDHAARMARVAVAQSEISARGTEAAAPNAGGIDEKNDRNFNKDQRGKGNGSNT